MTDSAERGALVLVIREVDYHTLPHLRHMADAILAKFMPEHDKRVRAEQREIDALTVLNAPLDSSHRRILRRDLATAIREASDD